MSRSLYTIRSYPVSVQKTNRKYLKIQNYRYNVCVTWNIKDITCIYEARCEKTVFGVSDQVGHKWGCTATEDGLRLEISD